MRNLILAAVGTLALVAGTSRADVGGSPAAPGVAANQVDAAPDVWVIVGHYKTFGEAHYEAGILKNRGYEAKVDSDGRGGFIVLILQRGEEATGDAPDAAPDAAPDVWVIVGHYKTFGEAHYEAGILKNRGYEAKVDSDGRGGFIVLILERGEQ